MDTAHPSSGEVSPDIQRLRHNVRYDLVHYRPPQDLKQYGPRLRKHNAAAKRAMMASVAGFGVVLPVLVDQHLTIVAGERIEDPGTTSCFDRLGYHSVGSGHRHALLTLVARSQHKTTDLETTIFNVFAAKRSSELAPGVGSSTEMRVISRAGVVTPTHEQMSKLERILAEDVKPRESTSEAIRALRRTEGDSDANG